MLQTNVEMVGISACGCNDGVRWKRSEAVPDVQQLAEIKAGYFCPLATKKIIT